MSGVNATAEQIAQLRYDLDTARISEWRSIVTLIVFVVANVIVLFPFHIPIRIPASVANKVKDIFSTLRITAPRHFRSRQPLDDESQVANQGSVLLRIPVNFITAPLVADLFLLAILAIGRDEVYAGTIGANHIAPYDILLFFLSLTYIAISIDASGLIRYLAFKVLQKGGSVGHRLFFYLYAFFFVIGTCIGNDPIILSGTAFLAYMTRVSRNIVHSRAWIHSQFAIANIASAILVTSNPTNLVLAGAFQIQFTTYTAHIIVPVIFTAIILFPFLLYVIFADQSLIPLKIDLHQLPEASKKKKPVNPNIPVPRGAAAVEEKVNGEEEKTLSLEEIMNPFVDHMGAAAGGILMFCTLAAVLGLNAGAGGIYPAFYATLPAAVMMILFDLGIGWRHRHETREIARQRREDAARALAALEDEERERERRELEGSDGTLMTPATGVGMHTDTPFTGNNEEIELAAMSGNREVALADDAPLQSVRGLPQVLVTESSDLAPLSTQEVPASNLTTVSEKDRTTSLPSRSLNKQDIDNGLGLQPALLTPSERDSNEQGTISREKSPDLEKHNDEDCDLQPPEPEPASLTSILSNSYGWCHETFPTTTAVLSHLPFALVVFAFCMFVLVQALVTKGWVPVFAYGWDHWVTKTGTVGAIGGMGFLSVIMCNFAGTNIGTTILLSRVIQAWGGIHILNGTAITERDFQATIYAMALGVNYGAFSIAFSASLAGLLWRDILLRKHIRVQRLEFARINIPIITISMLVGCIVLLVEVYIKKGTGPADLNTALPKSS